MSVNPAPKKPAAEQEEAAEANEDDSADEYSVEDIRKKRKNQKTGILEYLIKWENFPESECTWEPIHHLQCPDMIARFEERESNKRKRRRLKAAESLKKKRMKSDAAEGELEPPLLMEDESNDASEPSSRLPTQTNDNDEQQQKPASSTSTATATATTTTTTTSSEKPEPAPPKGFERGLSIERIVGSCTDDDDKIWFFVKWSGLPELELIEAVELEDKAPREMCQWYRNRLYYTVKHKNPEMPDPLPAPLRSF